MAAAAWLFWWVGPSVLVLVQGDRIDHTYYLPSQSMLPTLDRNDRVMPLRVGAEGLHRGDIVVFKTVGEVRVARIAALAGDTIALRDGVVTINGRVAAQRTIGKGPDIDGTPSLLRRERFPGDPRSHSILEIGPSPFDTVAAQRVGAGRVFVLGDNRDRAADSRVSLAEQGVEQVKQSDVIGVVDTVYWSQNRSRIGRPIDANMVQGNTQ